VSGSWGGARSGVQILPPSAECTAAAGGNGRASVYPRVPVNRQ
jgi:hypothetical protein